MTLPAELLIYALSSIGFAFALILVVFAVKFARQK